MYKILNSIEKKVYLVSLGCAKNLVDSENMLGLLKERGFSVSTRLEDAGVAIINTCGFIQSAVEECIDTIFEVLSEKKTGKLEKLFVVGCLVQRYGYKLRDEIPEVDGWLGTGEIYRIADLLEEEIGPTPPFHIDRPKFLADHTIPRIQTTPFYSAYLKIAEGCSHNCSFCMIPSLRGCFRSRELKSLVVEAENMVYRGVKEINLIAQDTSMYGRDLGRHVCLEDLIEGLLRLKELAWIRILYAHPYGITERLLKIMDSEERVCPYLDLPFQHVNKEILKAMGRGGHYKNPLRLIERIRSMNRPVSIRTTLMVGFPGETEDIFEELYAFVRSARFDHLGTFIYSPEKGTPAARLRDLPDHKIAEERLEAIMTLQHKISENNNQQFLNHVLPVLVEGVSSETDLLLKGRTAKMAPDIDGRVLINKGEGIIGEITPVLIKEAYAYDLIGEIV